MSPELEETTAFQLWGSNITTRYTRTGRPMDEQEISLEATCLPDVTDRRVAGGEEYFFDPGLVDAVRKKVDL